MGTDLNPAVPARALDAELQALRLEISRLTDSRDAAETAAEARNRFLAHISHELRTPLNSIMGMTRLVLATELTPEQRDHLDVVQISAENLLTLVNDLLDQAQIDAGALKLDEVPFRLDDLLRSTLKAIQVLADHKNLALGYNYDPSLPLTVVGDPTRLRQVLLNLLGNAVKFTEAGSIELHVAGVPDQIGKVRFTVSDTGIGIAADKLDEIFQDFVQADESSTRKYGGTGLGLSIGASLVRLMGGDLTVQSRQGAGSSFSFTADLPEYRPTPVGDGRPRHPYAKLLVVTDQRQARSGWFERLDHHSFTPEVVDDAAAAIHLLEADDRSPYAGVLIDQQTDVLDVAWQLQRSSGTTPMILVAPGGQRGDAARCRELGIRAYLTGPLVAADVVDAMEAALAGTRELITRHWLKERRRVVSVVVADDSSTNRELLTALLRQRGHNVAQAATGSEAIDAVAKNPFDAVLLDLHMPEVDGYEAATQIRAMQGPISQVPIIAVSGSVSEEGKNRCREIGIDEFLTKPYDPEHLLEVVETLAGV